MENQKKKLRLDELKVESFVTDSGIELQTANNYIGGSTMDCTQAATNCIPGCVGPPQPTRTQCGGGDCPTYYKTCEISCYGTECSYGHGACCNVEI